jgi:hypothetical protein
MLSFPLQRKCSHWPLSSFASFNALLQNPFQNSFTAASHLCHPRRQPRGFYGRAAPTADRLVAARWRQLARNFSLVRRRYSVREPDGNFPSGRSTLEAPFGGGAREFPPPREGGKKPLATEVWLGKKADSFGCGESLICQDSVTVSSWTFRRTDFCLE